ncbi:phosphate ABC transporter substrate-binding protein [Paucibacter sp. R3-3]|uniref:Phosphate ABC transporter substrate-binding protein n=1 Tax=Roseateles agri TaxID=3098619 RepID=A0ABU5DLS0_9BURK|nr:phosphate ABC transporter substrate-binding protein [Paucibacter sp. R3-3]MDY0746052.1 phosphate ABC transporter substrate-binding protein [Paucibacter sp. R3-3]
MPDYAKSGPLTLRINLDDYAVSAALKDGRVTSDLVKLEFVGPKPANKGFKPMVREDAYDAGELAIVTYLQARAYGKPYTALPLPVSGRFQHHSIGYNKAFGELTPKDIEGKKVGVRTYAQTTGLWVRGILQHEYGVDLDKVTWMTIGEAHLSEYQDPPNCQRLPKGSSLAEMMLNGELAAAIMGSDMPKDPRIERLIPEPQEAAKAWHAREQFIPINHLFVVHDDLAQQRPDVVRELARLLIESRNLAPAETFKTFPPIGLAANRKSIEFASRWAFEQKIIPREIPVDEMFSELTASLAP